MNLHKSNLQLFDTDPYKRNQRSSSHTIYKDQTHTPIMQSLHGIEDKSNFLQETIYIIIEKVKQEIIQQFKSEGSVKGNSAVTEAKVGSRDLQVSFAYLKH